MTISYSGWWECIHCGGKNPSHVFKCTNCSARPEPKTCVNCAQYGTRGDEEPCYSCNKNPQTQIEDNWTGYTLGKETVIDTKIGKLTLREVHETK